MEIMRDRIVKLITPDYTLQVAVEKKVEKKNQYCLFCLREKCSHNCHCLIGCTLFNYESLEKLNRIFKWNLFIRRNN